MLAISDRDRPCSARISPSSLDLDGRGHLEVQLALRALHVNLAAIDGDIDAARDYDRHPSDS
jgi:hypothetical protein